MTIKKMQQQVLNSLYEHPTTPTQAELKLEDLLDREPDNSVRSVEDLAYIVGKLTEETRWLRDRLRSVEGAGVSHAEIGGHGI
jgi:hypothetical protein